VPLSIIACWAEVNLGFSAVIIVEAEFVLDVFEFELFVPTENCFSFSLSPQNDNAKKTDPTKNSDLIATTSDR
jgi:hypothetical protein